MTRPRLTEEERKRRRSERFKKWYANRTPGQKERYRAAKRQYHRDCRASFKKMGIPYLTEDEKRRKAEKQRMRYANDPEYRKRVRQQQKDWRRRKKERLEEEAYQRRLAMSRDARKILNY